jgi:hypothetical protein
MRLTSLLSGLLLLTLKPSVAQQPESDLNRADFYPSAELLEFLADYGDLDEETYSIIEYHALQDSTTVKANKTNEN